MRRNGWLFVISLATLLAVLDSVASGGLIFDDAVGTGVEANTVSKASANDISTVIADGDPNGQADLLPALRTRAALTVEASLWRSLGAYPVWQAFEAHLGGLNAFLKAHDARVSPIVRDLGFAIDPSNLMPPVVDPMATFAVTGSGVGTYAHVADVDTSLYGKAWLDLKATSLVGAQSIVATVSGTRIDGTAVSKSATIPNGSPSGTVVHLGTLGVSADAFVAVTGVTITGGTNGDAFKVLSRVERAIPATS